MGRAQRALPGRRYDRQRVVRANKMAESSLCKRTARFREEDPDRFPRRSSEASSWMKVTRRGIADAAAIVAAPGGGVAVSDPPHPQGGSERAQGPAGAAEADIAAAMRAAASL